MPLLGTVGHDTAEGIAFRASLEICTLRRGFFAKVADVTLVFCYVLKILKHLSRDILAYGRSCRVVELLGDITRSARLGWSTVRF